MPASEHILFFDQISNKDVPRVGGKNASLGEMYNQLNPKGIGIPNGFALTAKNIKTLAFHFFGEAKKTFSHIFKPIYTILLLVCFAQLINPELNGLIQGLLTGNPKLSIPLIAIAGVGGSFVTGSATMSNLLLGNSIQTFPSMSLSTPLLLALLHTGSAVGNAISLQNIIMVKSVVQQPVREEKILSHNLIAVSLYITLSMLIAIIILRYK